MINILFWNIRGVGNPTSRRRLKRIINKSNVSIVAIQEPMTDSQKINKLVHYLNFSNAVSNCNGKIWILWNHNWNVQLVGDSEQILSLSISTDHLHSKHLFSCVYAKCNYIERRPLWDEIIHLSSAGYESWVIGGGF